MPEVVLSVMCRVWLLRADTTVCEVHCFSWGLSSAGNEACM